MRADTAMTINSPYTVQPSLKAQTGAHITHPLLKYLRPNVSALAALDAAGNKAPFQRLSHLQTYLRSRRVKTILLYNCCASAEHICDLSGAPPSPLMERAF